MKYSSFEVIFHFQSCIKELIERVDNKIESDKYKSVIFFIKKKEVI